MKKIIKYFPLLFLSLLFSSCLKTGLDELPAFSDAEITQFRFEYRWLDETSSQLRVAQLTTTATIDEATGSVNCILTVPEVGTYFPAEVRAQVTLSNIVGYADISIAAIMKPIGDAPKLGIVADYSKTKMEYEITAADGTSKTWSLNITAFNK